MITIDDVGDALAAALNASDFSQEISGEWDYLPTHRIEDLATLKVPIVPASLTMEEYSRGADLNDFTLEVAVQKRSKTEQSRRELSRLTQEIAKHCLRLSLLSDLLHCIKVEVPTLYDSRFLQEADVWTSVVRVTFRAIQEA